MVMSPDKRVPMPGDGSPGSLDGDGIAAFDQVRM
jgi:hypothetical protein